jgi:hypothetical protein
MASSKFSRRPRIQQPPPVCRSKMPLPFPPFIPSPVHTELWIDATWEGECTDGIYRSLTATALLVPAYPADPPDYFYESPPPPPTLRVYIPDPEKGAGWISFIWSTGTWFCIGYGEATIPTSGTYDTGIVNCYETFPAGKSATFRLYTA